MEIKQQKQNDVMVVGLIGRIDSAVAKEFELGVMTILDQGEKKIIFDFSELDYISSAGLRVLLMAAKKIKADSGKLNLCSMKPTIKEVFDVSGFSTMLPISATVADSLATM